MMTDAKRSLGSSPHLFAGDVDVGKASRPCDVSITVCHKDDLDRTHDVLEASLYGLHVILDTRASQVTDSAAAHVCNPFNSFAVAYDVLSSRNSYEARSNVICTAE